MPKSYEAVVAVCISFDPNGTHKDISITKSSRMATDCSRIATAMNKKHSKVPRHCVLRRILPYGGYANAFTESHLHCVRDAPPRISAWSEIPGLRPHGNRYELACHYDEQEALKNVQLRRAAATRYVRQDQLWRARGDLAALQRLPQVRRVHQHVLQSLTLPFE